MQQSTSINKEKCLWKLHLVRNLQTWLL